MSQEDVVQVNDYKYVDFTVAGSPVAAVINKQKGFGIFARLGAGTYTITAVPGSGKPSFDMSRTMVKFISKEGFGVFGSVSIDFDNSTSTVLRVKTFDDAAVTTDISGAFVFSENENIKVGG